MRITNVVMPASKYALKCPYEMEMEDVTIHNSANDASAMAEISYMIGNNSSTSFHAAVDDTRVVTGIPENRNAFHAGDGRSGRGNRKSYSIEICYSKSGGDRFDAAEENAAAYTAMILKEHNWGIDRVKKHQDWSGKYCPHRTLDLGWQRFLNKVQRHLDEQNNYQPEDQQEGGDLEMAKLYRNGSTPEPVYSDTNLTNRIGSLNPREEAEYLSIDNDRPLVRYKVDGTDTYKCGYVLWKGGCK